MKLLLGRLFLAISLIGTSSSVAQRSWSELDSVYAKELETLGEFIAAIDLVSRSIPYCDWVPSGSWTAPLGTVGWNSDIMLPQMKRNLIGCQSRYSALYRNLSLTDKNMGSYLTQQLSIAKPKAFAKTTEFIGNAIKRKESDPYSFAKLCAFAYVFSSSCVKR
jgi:hypothetical protein